MAELGALDRLLKKPVDQQPENVDSPPSDGEDADEEEVPSP